MDQAFFLCGMGVLSAVYRRDGGICAQCGLDTELLENRLREINRRRGYRWLLRLTRRLSLRPFESQGTLWQADHIKPVRIYGPAMSLDEFQTLCIWCHKRKTKEQVKRKDHESGQRRLFDTGSVEVAELMMSCEEKKC